MLSHAFRVVPTGYYGPIASDCVLDQAVGTSFVNVRKHGAVDVIEAGRILSEFRHFAGCLDFVESVVAENAAVVALPNGHTTLLEAASFQPWWLREVNVLTTEDIDVIAGRGVGIGLCAPTNVAETN